jgi:HSP20 family protein
MYPSLTTYPGDLFAEFDAMQRQLGRLFGEWPSSIRAAARGAFPPVNMGTTGEAVEIYAFAPGLDPASIDVSVDKGLLSISGQRASTLPGEAEGIHLFAHERFEGAFKRVVGLPDDVDPARIQATYRNGVLRIAVPKRERTKPRRIEIQGQDPLEHKQ